MSRDQTQRIIEATFRIERARLVAGLARMVRSIDRAEELAQETLLRGLRKLATLADPAKVGPWLRGIALRVCLDWRGSAESRQVTFTALGAGGPGEELPAREGSADESAEHDDDLRQLMAEVAALPEHYREVLLLYYYQDATYQELAEILGVSAATINARLTKARAMLRERLAEQRR